jgi:hypothetical protein
MREQVVSLAGREHACCPFLHYRVETAEQEVVWTTTNVIAGEQRAAGGRRIPVALGAR